MVGKNVIRWFTDLNYLATFRTISLLWGKEFYLDTSRLYFSGYDRRQKYDDLDLDW